MRRLEVRALRSAADCLAQRGEYYGAIEWLEQWTHLEPWDEGSPPAVDARAEPQR